MRNLLNFLAKYNNLIIFLLLEGAGLYMLAAGDGYHNSRFVKGIRGLTNGIEKKISNARSYFHLHEINQRLARENISLQNNFERRIRNGETAFYSVLDTVHQQQYTYSSAEIVNNSVNRQKNFFTLNKGKMQGLSVDMGIITDNGVAGVIVGCSENYSVAMSLINIDFRLSARIKTNGYFGSVTWDGVNYRYATLSEIPQHVTFGIGDTIETTGFSAFFPEGIMVGTVSDFEKSGGDFYKIRILLKADFKKLQFVTAIGNLKKTEKIELENQFQ